MLEEIIIRNFAIIDDLNIVFQDGLTVLSGETGAGKSIIINAVNLLLGHRASAQMIRTGAETAELEAVFRLDPKGRAAAQMLQQGFDASETLCIRRIIAASNRHRIYINGSPATVQNLTAITEHLASISGQHAFQGLLKEDQHLFIIDQFGSLLARRVDVRQTYLALKPLLKELERLRSLKRQQDERLESLEFQQRELDEAAIRRDEDEQLAAERTRLKSSAFLLQTVQSAMDLLYNQDGAVMERLSHGLQQIESAARIDPALAPLSEHLRQIGFGVEELVERLRTYQDTVDMDSQRLEAIESRLNLLQRLKRKYGGSIEDLLQQQEIIAQELAQHHDLTFQISALKKSVAQLQRRLSDDARSLSIARREAAGAMVKKVEEELAQLNMASARFEVAFNPAGGAEDASSGDGETAAMATETGLDRVAFLLSPNPGESLRPLAAIASGGELSRIVLALKVILAATESVATVVFDEVDAGIGGGVAEVVGRKLAHLARFHQVICITHLPQIARFAQHHFRLSKEVIDGRTFTALTALDSTERVMEMARMLGGLDITPATIAHAREMLASASLMSN